MKRGSVSNAIYDVSAKRTKQNDKSFSGYRALPKRSTALRHTDYLYCPTCKLSHAQRDGHSMHPAVEYLLDQGGNEDNQKSDAWLRARCSKATGTFYASCLPKNHSNFNMHTTRTGAFLNKLNLAMPFKGNDATRHGERFEDVAIEAYRHLVNNDTIQAFGLLEHPFLSWLGASPDGITNGGIAIEVKCPYYRWLKKDGQYPVYYYPQPQLVMDIAGLEVAHFIQFKPPVIRKIKKGTKMVRDRYTRTMKEIPIYEKVYEDNVEKMLMHGHDKSQYMEPLVMSVVEVLRNRNFFYSNLKHVESMWALVTQVYKDNLVTLGNANMIRALHANRMSLPQFVARLHLAFRREGQLPIDYVRLVTGHGPLRNMSSLHKELGGVAKLNMALTRFNVAKVLEYELPIVGQVFASQFGEKGLKTLEYTFTKADPPPYYRKARVKARLQKLITPNPDLDTVRRISMALDLDSPIVDDLTAFCTANNVPFVSVTEEGQTEPVTTRAFNVEELKQFVKRKGTVPLVEKLLDYEESDAARVEPQTLGTTIYYRCGDYTYNPRKLKPTKNKYFGGSHGLPKRHATSRLSSHATTPYTSGATRSTTRSVAPGRTVAAPTDMFALYAASQNPTAATPSVAPAKPVVASTSAHKPMDMFALYNASQSTTVATRSVASAKPVVASTSSHQPMDMFALYNASQSTTVATRSVASAKPVVTSVSAHKPMDMFALYNASLNGQGD